MTTLVGARLDSIVSRKQLTPVAGLTSDAFRQWLVDVMHAVTDGELYPTIVWPATADRGRIYVHLLDASGNRRAFAKLSLDPLNSRLIDNERRALERLRNAQLQRTKVPAVIACGALEDKAWLIMQPTPADARPLGAHGTVDLSENIRELGGPVQRREFSAVQGEWWWERFTTASAVPRRFVDRAHHAAASGIDVCRVHGDLNHTNLLLQRDNLWMLDWEQSSEHGPVLTDFICANIDRAWPGIIRNPIRSLRQFLENHWNERAREHQNKVVLALAFLAGAGFPPALALIKAWHTD